MNLCNHELNRQKQTQSCLISFFTSKICIKKKKIRFVSMCKDAI